MRAFQKVSDWPWREKLAFPSFPSSIAQLTIRLLFLSLFSVLGFPSLYQRINLGQARKRKIIKDAYILGLLLIPLLPALSPILTYLLLTTFF